jgi:putative nucleotidyltransferase with HDIG domain
MTDILVADDDASVLRGLRLALRRERGRWDVRYAHGADALRAELGQRPADLIVADLQEAAALESIAEEHPRAVRVALSASASSSSAARSSDWAHRTIAKPCAPAELVAQLNNLTGLIEGASEPLLAHAGHAALPAAPGMYAQISRVVADPDEPLQRVAEFVEQDPGVAAQLLRMVNSPLFGLRRTVSSVGDAVMLLGANMVRDLVLATSIDKPGGAAAIRTRGLSTARIARKLCSDEAAFTAGLLHDIGCLTMPDTQGDIQGERAARGTDHAEVGAFVLALWGLPQGVVDAVATHHADPGEAGRCATALQVASRLVAEVAGPADRLLDAWAAREGQQAKLKRARTMAREW